TNMDLWNEWEELYQDELDLDDVAHAASRRFVADNFDTMHEGSDLFWMDNYDRRKEVSALHRAMIKREEDLKTFMSEQQLDPIDDSTEISSLHVLDADEIACRVSNYARNELPDDVDQITGFVDIAESILHWCVIAWLPNTRGHILDYGTWPEQPTRYFSKTAIPITLQEKYGSMTVEDLVRIGLSELLDDLMQREWGDVGLEIERCGIDVGYAKLANDVREICRDSPYKSRLHPAKGRGERPDAKNWQKLGKSKRRRGINCALVNPETRGGCLELRHNTWPNKTEVAERLTIPASSQKAITLYDTPSEHHVMLGEHCAEVEEPVLNTLSDGTEFISWKSPGGVVDNDYWDCINGCYALSTIGMAGGIRAKPAARKSDSEPSKFAQRLAQMRAR
ncbi:MAG: terminase gpA endonuclease subunit, partial [Planctomycetota bacterium]